MSLESAVHVAGRVVKGFGRGSKELGCPTADLASPEAGEARLRGSGQAVWGSASRWARSVEFLRPPRVLFVDTVLASTVRDAIAADMERVNGHEKLAAARDWLRARCAIGPALPAARSTLQRRYCAWGATCVATLH